MRIFINHVYYSPVGHVVEALKVARGISAANPDAGVSVALNASAAHELAKACPWLDQILKSAEDFEEDLSLLLPYSVQAEFEHPNTPAEVKRNLLGTSD